MTTKMKVIIIGGFFVLLAIAGVIASKAEAKKVGDACETYQSEQCSGEGGACLATSGGNYCSVPCNAKADCPASWKCAEIEASTYSGQTGEKVGSKGVKMCVKP